MDEVLPELLGRPHAEPLGQRPHLGGPEQRGIAAGGDIGFGHRTNLPIRRTTRPGTGTERGATPDG
ncbi:hypothetical protein, partial [Acinetobacter baumannii]|uniref:hypothetical protein n=1 Tax=Acinetobacter baumannii TaxID=470 RepID=UPI00227972AF